MDKTLNEAYSIKAINQSLLNLTMLIFQWLISTIR